MIDTDKYEGHTEGPWSFNEDYLYELMICAPALKEINPDNITFVFNNESVDVNKQLLADAPFILQALIDERAEVKRLREVNALLASQIRLACEWVESFHNEGAIISFMEHVHGDEEE